MSEISPQFSLRDRFAALTVFALAVLVYSLNLDRPPHPDELHHVIAAQQIIETGRPILADGEYWRGIAHTWIVAFSYTIFGESLAAARLPSVLMVALVVTILFVWIRREVDSKAAWLTAVLYLTSPFSVEIAQFCRFYAPQVFCFTLGTMFAYYAFVPASTLSRRMLFAFFALAFIGMALVLQETSAMGVLGILIWIFGAIVVQVGSWPASKGNRRAAALVAVLAAPAVCLAILWQFDLLSFALWRYRNTELFAASSANEFWYYHARYILYYPTLWTLTVVLALCAIARHPRLGWLAGVLFITSFLLTSFAGQKATRYLSFAQPFLAILWGVGLAACVTTGKQWFRELRLSLAGSLALPQRVRNLAGTWLIGTAIGILVVLNPFWLRSASMIANVTMPTENPTTDWDAAREELMPWVRGADIMVTTEELGAIYFLGRSDVRFSPSKLRELPEDQRVEFGIDSRVGRPVISQPESFRRLVQCFDHGIIVGPVEHWGSPILIDDVMQSIIRTEARPIPVPKKSHLYAWGWSREASAGQKPTSCRELERFSGLHRGR